LPATGWRKPACSRVKLTSTGEPTSSIAATAAAPNSANRDTRPCRASRNASASSARDRSPARGDATASARSNHADPSAK
jgi:hypothetical protein